MDADSYNVLIIGGGVIGMSVALNAAEMGFGPIAVLERDHVGSGSSGLSASIVSRQFTSVADIQLRAYGYARFDELERLEQLPFTHNGYIELGGLDTDKAVFEQALELQRQLSISDTSILNREELGQAVPHLRTSDISFGFYDPAAGFTDGYLVSTALAGRARKRGVRIVQNATVRGSKTDGGLVLLETDVGTLPATTVVNAAGPWAQQVGDILGAPVKLIPQRHEICLVSLDSDLPYLMPFVLEPEWPNDPFRLYVRHEGPRLLLVGLHTDQLDALPAEDPDTYIRTPDEEYVEIVGERLLARFPRLPNPAFVRGWAGLYPLSVDGYPVVGRHPSNPQILLAIGGGSSGIQMAPTIGRLAAETLRYGQPLEPSLASIVNPTRPGSGVR